MARVPRSVAGEFARFAAVGLTNTALSWSLYAVGVSAGVWYPLAAAGSFAAGAVNGYTLNRLWTFRGAPRSASRLARYAIVQAIALGIDVGLLAVLVEVAHAPRLAAQMVVLPLVAALSFGINRAWTFQRVATGPSISRDAIARAIAAVAALGVVGAATVSALVVSSHRSFLSPPSRKEGFPAWLGGPWHSVRLPVPRHVWPLMTLFLLTLAAMIVGYLIVVSLGRWTPAKVVVGAVVMLHVVFVLSPPFPLTDVFNYLGYARLGVLHGLNPFTHAPIAFKHDAAYHLATWHHLRTPYGPLFTIGTYALVPLGLVKGYWTLKVLTALASLGCLALVWRCARALGRPPAAALAFVGLNPLLLAYGLGGFHNDFFMMLLVLTGVLLVIRGRSALGAAAGTAAVAVKVAAGVLVPFLLLGARRRVVAVAAAVATGALILAGSVAMFGTHDPGLVDQATKVVGPYSVPSELGMLFGFSVDPATRHVVGAILAAVVVVLVVRAWRGADWIATAGWAALALAAAQIQPMPWYVVWALPFAALSRSRALKVATLILGGVLLVNSTPTQNLLLMHTLHLPGLGSGALQATGRLLH